MALLPEILHQVALYCDPPTSRALRSTCKILRALITEKNLIEAEFNWRHTNRSTCILGLWATRKWHRDILWWCLSRYRRTWRLLCDRTHPILVEATAREDIAVVELLFIVCADVNAQDGEVLRTATRTGNVTIIERLLDEGADIDGWDETEGTVLDVAAQWGHTDVVKSLIERGADPSLATFALFYAVVAGNIPMIQDLVDGGFDVYNDGNDALIFAVQAGNLTIVQMLLDGGADVESDNKALRTAVGKCDMAITKALLRAGMQINQGESGRYENVLTLAVSGGNMELVTFLLLEGADVSAKKWEAMVVAASMGHKGVLRLFLHLAPERGGKGEAEFLHGLHKALAAASECGHIKILRLLWEVGSGYA
ncbi:hypothetical protein HDV00_005212 [Rhizophlyctis rosea]|nr:hypothetical protein HDV00_005212 [Rhizophlyctis rosea]